MCILSAMSRHLVALIQHRAKHYCNITSAGF